MLLLIESYTLFRSLQKLYEPSGRIRIIIGDAGSLREENTEGNRLENRLKMKDLEDLKHAFDVEFLFYLLFIS